MESTFAPAQRLGQKHHPHIPRPDKPDNECLKSERPHLVQRQDWDSEAAPPVRGRCRSIFQLQANRRSDALHTETIAPARKLPALDIPRTFHRSGRPSATPLEQKNCRKSNQHRHDPRTRRNGSCGPIASGGNQGPRRKGSSKRSVRSSGNRSIAIAEI